MCDGEAGRAEWGEGRRDRGSPFLFCGEAPRSPCLRPIIYNEARTAIPLEASWTVRAGRFAIP